MNLVLTGAGGFLGTHILERLVNCEGVSVTAVTSKSVLAACDEWGPDRLSLVGPAAVLAEPSILSQADVLLNCAYPRSEDGRSRAVGLKYLNDLFSCAGMSGIGAVVNVSSQSVYDEYRVEPAKESDPVCLNSVYAVGKFATELMVDSLCAGKPHTNVRLASLIGPGFDQRVTNKLVALALKDKDLEIAENGHRFSYLDVVDAADGLARLALGDPRGWKPVYNLGLEKSYTLTDIANSIQVVFEEMSLGTIRITVDEQPDENVRCSSLDPSNIEHDYDWKPEHALEASIRRIAAAFLAE